MEFPVQLTPAQMSKIEKGITITLKPENFLEKSAIKIRLNAAKAKRTTAAIRKGRGVRIVLDDDEDLYQEMEGGKISLKKAFKKIGKEVKKDSGVVKRAFEDKVADPMKSKKAIEAYKVIGKHAIEEGIPVATMLASMALGDPTGASGAVVGNVASQYASRAYDKKVMEKEGEGLFKALHKAGAHKVGITKSSVTKRAKKIGKEVIEVGSEAVGDAITAYTGNPIAGEAFKVGAKKLGNAALESKNGKDALRKMKKEAKNIGAEMVDDYIDSNLTGPEKAVAQKALAGKYPSAKDLIYDYGSSKIEDIPFLEDERVQFTGFGMPSEGRPRYGGGRVLREKYVKDFFGGAINVQAPEVPSGVVQLGAPEAKSNSAAMNNRVFLPSPQLAPPVEKSERIVGGGRPGYRKYQLPNGMWNVEKIGGSFYPAGRYGGSFNPAG